MFRFCLSTEHEHSIASADRHILVIRLQAYLAINEGDSGLRLYYTICKFRIILDYQILDYQKNTPLYQGSGLFAKLSY